jgi:ubiquinone/menaquinone biosynthesis C-methylase UbiE
MRYNFGIYHWRRHGRAVAAVITTLILAEVMQRTTRSPAIRVMSDALKAGMAVVALIVGRKLFNPLPWVVGREKYDTLAETLPLEDATTVLDVGCGTGRSLVGLADPVSESCSVTGIDVFTDDIIFGNAPSTARRNAAEAGLDATIVIGDATALPFADDSQDIVTVSRMFHDLSDVDAQLAIAEALRVCAPDGRFGMVELPFPPGDGPPLDVPTAFWQSFVKEAGFTVETVKCLSWKDDKKYVIVTARP